MVAVATSFDASASPRSLDEFLRTWTPMPVEHARTFPSFMYTDPAVFELERARFFARRWIYVAHVAELPGPGTYVATSVAGFPLLVLRDKQGTLRAFHNVCPHRAAPVATGCGEASIFTCPYHAWWFDQEGRCGGAPGIDRLPSFRKEDNGLAPVELDTWGPFVFVNLDPAAEPLAAQMGDLGETFAGVRWDEWRRVHCKDYVTESNWKLYVENNAEFYHEPFVHKSVYSTNDVSWNNSHHLIRAEVDAFSYRQYTPFTPDSPEMTGGMPRATMKADMDERWLRGCSIMSFWPNFAWILNPNLAIIYLVDPQTVTRTRIRWEWLVPDTPEALAEENLAPLRELYDQVQQEDMDLLPQVQMVAGSPGYMRGPFFPQKELGVHRFDELLMEHLTGRR
ncbi:MAG: aromatic ring-hydroxylating dioxygenase subunit alpha [Thermodesulfobacteriota bacterium]